MVSFDAGGSRPGVYWYVHPFGFYFQDALIPVPIRDTDQLRETCAGMFGGEDAFIEGMWISASSAAGQLLLKPSTCPRINVPSYLQ